jgi:sulfite exporter TauE/SafE
VIEGEALAGFALLGLAGSLHCVGMCGGFVLTVAGQGPARGRVLSRALIFGLGKALTYAILGLALAQLAGRTMELVGLQRVFAWIAGALLILLGLNGLRGQAGAAGNPLAKTSVARAFGSLMQSAERLGGNAGAFGAGVVTGFLPCGLSWGAFVLAALAIGWKFLSVRMRSAGARTLGLLLIVFGIITVARG